jgi:hypothetical protein
MVEGGRLCVQPASDGSSCLHCLLCICTTGLPVPSWVHVSLYHPREAPPHKEPTVAKTRTTTLGNQHMVRGANSQEQEQLLGVTWLCSVGFMSSLTSLPSALHMFLQLVSLEDNSLNVLAISSESN